MAFRLKDNSLFTALAISSSINCCMILFGTLADFNTHLSGLAWISRLLGTPPGLLLGWLIHPRSHSIAAVIMASVEGLIGSIAFYTLVAWIILRILAFGRSSKSEDGQA